MANRVIEPARGATYSRPDRVAVYEYGVYSRSSVLAGHTRRVWLDEFESVEEAQRAFPDAEVSVGSRYAPASLSHLPDDSDL